MPEIKTEVPPEIFEADHHAEHEGHARLIAVAAVVTTLLAALTGFLQASALRTHDEADIRAERLGALSLYASAANRDQAQVQIERFQLLEQAQRQQQNAQVFATFAKQPSAGLEANRWRNVADNVTRDTSSIAKSQHLIATCPSSSVTACPAGTGQALPVIAQGDWYSPQQDPSFPVRYQQSAQWSAYFLSAQRDSANERGDAAETRFVHLAAALTMFAVAVFLFGYSLTPQGRRRRWLFARVATAFVVFGAVWTIYSLAGGIPSATARSAVASSKAYANGLVAFNDGNYGVADAALVRAAELRPRFADAWSQLAQVRAFEGTPPQYVDNEATQIPTVAELRASAAAEQKAIDAGSESPLVQFGLGANLLYIGLLRHDDAQVRQSRGDSATAATRFAQQLAQHRHPGAYLLEAEFNTAEADLVDGSASTRREYRAAERRLLSLQQETGVEPVVASALSDLNLIGQTRPRLLGRTKTLDDEIITAVTKDKNAGWNVSATHFYLPSGHDKPHFSGVQLFPDPGHLQYGIQSASQFVSDDDALSVQWEYRDPVNHNWEVLPDISGPVGQGNTNTLKANGDGTYISSNPSFLGETSPHTCLPAGQYRADLYANGKLAGTSAPATERWGALRGTGFPGISASFCRPPGWTGKSLGTGQDAFTSQDSSSGARLFVFPAAALAGESPERVMRLIVGVLSGARGPVPYAFHVGSSSPSYFMNFTDAREQFWGYLAGGGRAGVMWSAAGISPDNELYVGVVYGAGPDTKASIERLDSQLKDVLLSYSQL